MFEKTEQFFYEIYIQSNFSDANKFTDVPIAIKNYLGENAAVTNSDPLDITNLKFTRRYFKIDSSSGIRGNSLLDFNYNKPEYIRYLTKATLYINSNSDNKHMIYKPYLYLEYNERQNTSTSTAGKTATLEIHYKSEISTFYSTVSALFIVFSVLALFIAIARAYVWALYNPITVRREDGF